MDASMQIKNNLINRIMETKDINFLNALQTIFDSSERELFQLNAQQSESILKSKEEIKNGDFFENDEVISDLKKHNQSL